jgi:tetratricopeptide (TPR) repeat protein
MPRPVWIALGLLVMLAGLGALAWFIARTIRRAEDPARMTFKWALTFVVLGGAGYAIFGALGHSVAGAFGAPFLCVVVGIAMSLIWAPHLGAAFARPLTSLFDGGDQAPVPEPLYSIALARRKRGRAQEALYEVQRQLEGFPRDVYGQMLLAEIQAEDLHDLAAAEMTVHRLCHQPGHAVENVALALHQLADWHLKYAQDVPAARRALEHLIELHPNTEQAQVAVQRLSHLGRTAEEHLAAQHDRPAIALHPGAQNVGLLKDSSVLRKPEEDPAAAAAEYVKHLEQFPQDAEVREKLALLYAGHYQRPDLAVLELEQLVALPNQPAKLVARWLNAIADIQMKQGADVEAARQTLQRIIDRFPDQALAETARHRINLLGLEQKARAKGHSVRLGTYEQNIGLKKR